MIKQLKSWINEIRNRIRRGYVSSRDEEYADDKRSALLGKATPLARMLLYVIGGFFVIILVWAYFASIEQNTIGDGKVIPSSQVKIIQSLDGGIISKIMVREGEIVNKDTVLMQLDKTRYQAEYDAGYAKYLTLLATLARLNAEANDDAAIRFPKELESYPDIIKRETKLFETRRASLRDEITLLQKNAEVSSKQLNMYAELLPKGYVSKLEYYRAQQALTEVKIKIIERRANYYEDVKTELTKTQGELETLREQIVSLKDKMQRTTLYSPVKGIVKNIDKVTVGGVVTPGEPIMSIVPLEDTLLIETRIQPSDIAFIKVGQSASVKITAYDFSIYGSLKGRVEYISADTIEEKQPSAAATQTEYYIVNVRTNKNYLGSEKNKHLIMPGMTATVHIETGRKTVLQYLLKPLIKAKEEALRER